VADIFHEVDEEVRRERLKKLWDRYSIYIVAFAILIVAGIAAWRGYEWWLGKQAAAAGAAFEQAVNLNEQGKHAEAQAAFDKLAADAPGGYAVLARLRAAAGLVETRPGDAVKAYDALTADPAVGTALQDLASVRAAMLRVDAAPFDEMQRRLEALATSDRAFRHSARELLALSAWHHQDLAAAHKFVDMITSDAEVPPAMRNRVRILSALIAGAEKKKS
jgi:hypothetical protein